MSGGEGLSTGAYDVSSWTAPEQRGSDVRELESSGACALDIGEEKVTFETFGVIYHEHQ